MFVCPECGLPSQSAGHCPADGATLSPIGDDLVLGTIIGAYRIARLLGIGGMGRVYKGVHPTIGSRTAIKILSRECTDRRELVDRFFAEAKAVNLIRHESIVNVLDLATLPDGRPYIIMEYLDGAPLASIIEHAVATRTPLPLGGLARLAVEVLDALNAAHAKGIVHRDLKPDNIFVTPSGRPKVLDFGIAKLNDMATGSATRTGSLLGTPHYMSPEQAAGKTVEHRADIYAMGVILFECVTGTKPFLAESLYELLRQHLEVPPPSPRSLRPELSSDLENVILTALAKSPDQRFGSAQAMSVALQHATAQLAPEQWTPITGSGTHRAVPSGAWQPTPPASWGSGATRMPRGPRESVQPPNMPGPMPISSPPPHIGSQSTVSASAGQLQKAPTKVQKQPSRKGIWIGLGAALLVGGGITAAVVANNRGGERTETASNEVQPAEPPVAPPKVDDAPEEEAKLAPKKQPSLDDAFAELDKLDLSELPPDVRRQIEDLKKMPPQQRKKKIDDLDKQVGEQVGDLLAAEKDDSKAGGTPAPQPAPKKGGGGIWDGAYDVAPYKINPKKVDVTAFIKFAVAEARRADPKAQLTRIDAGSVSSEGFADFTLPSSAASSTSDIDVRFHNHERGRPDPKLPKGVPDKETQECGFRIQAGVNGVEIRTFFKAITEAGMCIKQKPVGMPRCSAKQIWAKAIAKGAPSDAVASLSFRGNFAAGGKIEWWFDISGGFDARFADDC
ncbi:MAG: protein kinase [Myxococcota bacterium]|nr:protein kinase [Myxococcota bacterium]